MNIKRLLVRKFLIIKSLIIVLSAVVFVKIYRKNTVIKLLYAKQKIDKRIEVLGKQKEDALAQIALYKNFQRLSAQAEQRGMRTLNYSQVITYTC